jgi:hypothetical protein
MSPSDEVIDTLGSNFAPPCGFTPSLLVDKASLLWIDNSLLSYAGNLHVTL